MRSDGDTMISMAVVVVVAAAVRCGGGDRYYTVDLPRIFDALQQLETQRLNTLRDYMKKYVDIQSGSMEPFKVRPTATDRRSHPSVVTPIRALNPHHRLLLPVVACCCMLLHVVACCYVQSMCVNLGRKVGSMDARGDMNEWVASMYVCAILLRQSTIYSIDRSIAHIHSAASCGFLLC